MRALAIDASAAAVITWTIVAYVAWLVFAAVHIFRAARAGDTAEVVGWVIVLVLGPIGAIIWLLIHKPVKAALAQRAQTSEDTQ